MRIDRGHDMDLFAIIEKIRRKERITFADRMKVGEIEARLDSRNFLEESERMQSLMCELRGKLYYIREYLNNFG